MKIKALFSLLLVAFAGTVFAGQLEDVLAKHYEAMGGEAVIRNTKSLKVSGKVVFKGPQGDMEIPFKAAMKDGDKMRWDAVMQGVTMTQATNGDASWQVMPMMGVTEPQDMNDEEAKQFKSTADFRGDLFDYKKKGHQVEYLGSEDVEGTPTHKLKVTRKDGEETTYFLDSEYFLIIKTTSVTKQMGQEIPTESFPSDYKPVNGFMMAHSMSNKSGMGEMVMVFEEVEHNPSIPDDFFAKPEAAEATAEQNK